MDQTRGFRPRAIGEIAIRCTDMTAMCAFYGETLGLERLPGNLSDDIVFFRIGEGVAGHTTVLALFRAAPDSPVPQTGPGSSLHHLALSLPYAEQEAAMAWYDRIGQPYTVQIFDWVGWRGVFTKDPEGNTVELVAFDPSLLASREP
ncbi:MAG: VOC family protein [Pseudomonadota bacterium]